MNPLLLERLGGLHYRRSPMPFMPSHPVDREDIAQLESEIGNRLPEEYAEFLLSYHLGPVAFGKNGVYCCNENGNRLWLTEFYSIAQLRFQFKMLELIPRHLLAMNDNAIGDFVCIAVAGDHRGEVFSWERDFYDYLGSFTCASPGSGRFAQSRHRSARSSSRSKLTRTCNELRTSPSG